MSIPHPMSRTENQEQERATRTSQNTDFQSAIFSSTMPKPRRGGESREIAELAELCTKRLPQSTKARWPEKTAYWKRGLGFPVSVPAFGVNGHSSHNVPGKGSLKIFWGYGHWSDGSSYSDFVRCDIQYAHSALALSTNLFSLCCDVQLT